MSSSMAVEQKGDATSRESSSSLDAPPRLDPWNTSDLAGHENHVPLSPQWLFPKPYGDSKPSQATGVAVCPDPPIKRDPAPSSEKKKDRWRLESEIGHKDRWSEEERDNTFVGNRHDRWKEEEREGKDLRKGDRWVVDPLFKEHGETRRLPQSEHRDTSFDSRRDVKWSNKWGPEDKDYEARREKWIGPEKDEGKYTSPISTKQDIAQDSAFRERDNIWRPHSLSTRGRGESPSFAAAPHKHAPGFGTGRARNDSSGMGFIAGRGRGSNSSNARNGHLSTAAIGGSPLVEKPDTAGGLLRYSRAKLLDIYRQSSALPSFAKFPEGLVEIHQLTSAGIVKPLALSVPNKEEEAILEAIEKGDILTGGAAPTASRDLHTSRSFDDSSRIYGRGKGPNEYAMEHAETEVHDVDPINESNNEDGPSKHKVPFESVDGADAGTGVWRPNRILDSDELSRRRDSRSDGLWRRSKSGDLRLESCQKFEKTPFKEDQLHSPLERNAFSYKDEKGWNAEKGTVEADMLFKRFTHGEVPYNTERVSHLSHADSSSARVGGVSASNSGDNDKKDSIKSNPLMSPEDLSLVYMDPQGEIQGPFLGVDIIGWFEAGYFGIDLPVRLANTPNGNHFMALGNMMPHLKPKPRVPPGFNAVKDVGDAPDRQNLQNRIPAHSSMTVSNLGQEPIEHVIKADTSGQKDSALFQNRLSGYPSAANSQFLENLQSPTRPWPNRDVSEMSPSIPGLGKSSAFEPNADPFFPLETFPGSSDTPSKISDRGEDVNSLANRNLPQAILDTFQAHLLEQQSRQQTIHRVCQDPYQSQMTPHQVGITHSTGTQDVNLNTMHGTAGLGQTRYLGLTQNISLNVLQQLSALQPLAQPQPVYGPLSPSGPVLDQLLRLQQQQQQQQHQQQLPLPALVDPWLRQQQLQPLAPTGPSQSALAEQLLVRQAGDAAKLEPQSQHQHHFFENCPLEVQALSHAGISQSNHADQRLQRQAQESVKFDTQAQQHSATGKPFSEQHLSEDLAFKLRIQKQRDEHAQAWPNGKDLEEAGQKQLSACVFPNNEPINLTERVQSSPAVHMHPSGLSSAGQKLDKGHSLEELEHARPDLPDVITRILLPPEKSPASSRDVASTEVQCEDQALDHIRQESISQYESSFPFSLEAHTLYPQELRAESTPHMPSSLGQSFAEARLPEGISNLDSTTEPIVTSSYESKSFFSVHVSRSMEEMQVMNDIYAQEDKPLVSPVPMGISAAPPLSSSGERRDLCLSSVEPTEPAWKLKQLSKPKSLLEIQEEEELEVGRQDEVVHSLAVAPSGDTAIYGPWMTSRNMAVSKSFKRIQEEEVLRNATKIISSSGSWESNLVNKDKIEDKTIAAKISETVGSKIATPKDSLPAISFLKNSDDIKLGHHDGKIAVSASLLTAVDDAEFLEPKEVKKSKRRNSKAKSAASKSTPVLTPDPVSATSATSKSSSGGKTQEPEKEMLLAPPPGPSLGDYFLTKEDVQTPQPVPAWSVDLWKQQSTALSLKEIQESEKKGKQEQKKLMQTSSQQQSQTQTISRASVTTVSSAKSAVANDNSAKSGWSQLSASPPSKTAIHASSSKAKQITPEDDDDLFWDYPDALKSGSNQKKSSKLDSKLDSMASLPKVSKPPAKWEYKESDNGVLSANSSSHDFPAFPDICAAKKFSAPVKGKKQKADKLTEAVSSVTVLESKISDCKVFHEWCVGQIKKLTGSTDMSLLDFCIALPTSKEAGEYLSCYLGKGAEVQAFEVEFMRQKDLLSRDILCQLFSPSEAVLEGDITSGIADMVGKVENATSNSATSLQGNDSSSKTSKKKSKKGKKAVDPSLLGFSVTSSRILMGEIQHVEE